jgi:hypothetical protein
MSFYYIVKRVQGSGFWVQGSGFRVLGSGFCDFGFWTRRRPKGLDYDAAKDADFRKRLGGEILNFGFKKRRMSRKILIPELSE